MTNKIATVTNAAASAVGGFIGGAAASTASAARKAGVGKEGTTTHATASTVKDGVVALVEVFDAMHDAGRHIVQTSAAETATSVEYRSALAVPPFTVDCNVRPAGGSHMVVPQVARSPAVSDTKATR